jgi:hypothetical protein
MIRRNLLRRARYEVQKNLSRLAADWRNRVSAAISELNSQAIQCAEDELAALDQTVSQAPSTAPGLQQAIDDLECFQHKLRAHAESVA